MQQYVVVSVVKAKQMTFHEFLSWFKEGTGRDWEGSSPKDPQDTVMAVLCSSGSRYWVDTLTFYKGSVLYNNLVSHFTGD